MKCPAGLTCCPCPEFSKEGLCDFPYKNGMSYEELRALEFVILPKKEVG